MFSRGFRKIDISDNYIDHACLYVHMKQLGSHCGFTWNFAFEYFSRIRRENSSFIKAWEL